MGVLQKFRGVVILVTFAIFQSSPVTCNTLISNELAYNREAVPVVVGKTKPVKSLHQISNSISRNDNTGNVIFNDNIAFGGGGGSSSRQERKYYSATGEEREQRQVSNSVAGGFLQNHRLEGPLSPEVVSSSAAAAAAISPTSLTENDLKLAGSSDNSHQERNIHTAGHFTGGGATFSGGGQGRSYVPNQYQQSHGWASNSGSCLFSCSSGTNFGGASSCCQQNYVQCCPNANHEQWNFKNLHHGRGYGYGSTGSIPIIPNFKGGNGWGSPLPYNPPPIVRPKLCQPHHPIGLHAGGNILHKGIETLKHGVQNIGQFFKGHVGSGWTAGGNGAAGYYFHRRSDDTPTDERKHYGINSSKKRRHTRSVNKGWGSGGGGFDQVVVPCPVYSSPPSLGWPPVRPHNVGLGSLIGWTVPGNQIHGGFLGSGYSSGQYHQHGSPVGGYGWGGGSNFCRSDYECPGGLRCCKGVCQVAPHLG